MLTEPINSPTVGFSFHVNEFSNIGAWRFLPFSAQHGFDTLQREMWSGDIVGAASRWIWAVRILVLGFAALATVHLIGGITRRNAVGPLFWASVIGVALSLLAYGAILGLLSTEKRLKLGLVLAGGLGAARFLFTIPYIWPQLYAHITGLFGVRVYASAVGPGARYLKPIAVLSLALAVTATMAYRTMERRSSDWRVLLLGVVIVVFYVAGVRLLVATMTSHLLLH